MSKATFFATLSEFAGYRDTYIVAEGLSSGNALNGVYYDGELCCYALARYFNTTSPYYGYADNCNTAYAVEYGDAASWILPGYWVFAEGLIERYLRRGDAGALADVNSMMDSAAYMQVSSPGLNDEGRTASTRHEINREFAYCVLGYIQLARAQTLTANQITRRDYCYESSLTIIDDWSANVGGAPATQTASYFRPFMGAITAHALINYYENVATDEQKTTIKNALIQLANYAWDNCWDEAGEAFTYTDRDVGVPEDLLPQADLNMLIAPWYAWLWSVTFDSSWKTKAEAIFAGGESIYEGGFWQSGAYLGTQNATNPIGKHIDQQLVWGVKYFDYIEATETSTVEPPTIKKPQIPQEPVGMRQRGPRILSFVIDGISEPAAIDEGRFHGTITDNGVGDYTITINEHSKRPLVVIGCICSSTGCYSELASTTTSAVRIKIKTMGGIAINARFTVTILAFSSVDQH